MEQAEQHPIQVPAQAESKILVLLSRIISGIFSPFIIPFLAFCLLFFCTYLRIIPFQARIQVLTIVASFTIAVPLIAIYLFQWLNGLSVRHLGERKQRHVPYLLTILGHATCLILMNQLNFPRYMTGIIMASLLCMVCRTLINFRWKISVHVASGGLMVGGLVSYGILFYFNPIGWLAAFILLSGMLGTARMVLCRHTLWEVFIGFLVGLLCGIIGILFI